MKLSISKLIGQGYNKGWFTNCHARYRVYAGARATKKSVDILGVEPVVKIISDPWRNVLIVRQNQSDNAQSTYTNLQNVVDQMGLSKFFKFRNQPLMVEYLPTGQVIVFRGMNNPTGETSLKAKVGFFSDVYFEESSELKSFEDFRKVDGSIRIGIAERERYGIPREANPLQLTLIMNPWNKRHWVYETFFKGRLEDDPAYLDRPEVTHMDFYDPDFTLGFGSGLYLHKSTYKINEFRDPSKDLDMRRLRSRAPEIYKVEGLGCWGNSTGATYPEFSDTLVVPLHTLLYKNLGGYCVGIDTGLSNGEGKPLRGEDAPQRIRSATTMQLVGVSYDGEELIAFDEYYDSNQGRFAPKTEPEQIVEIVKTLKEWKEQKYYAHPILMKGVTVVCVDCADIGFRQGLELEARRQGLRNCQFVASTKMRIQTRVDFSRVLMAYGDCLFSPLCANLTRELRNSHMGENGEPREDFDDHATNAWEYAWAPLAKKVRAWKTFKPRT